MVLVGCWCCAFLLWNAGKESRVSLEPAFWLQNKARKTNMGLKLDFPKHCIPSHFTHHCGLKTRIESPVKSASDSGWCSHWKIGQMSVFWMYLKSESFNLLVVFRETSQFILICYYHSAILAIKKFPFYSFAPTLHVISTPLFPLHQIASPCVGCLSQCT